MSDISRGRHASGLKSLRQKHYKRLRDDIKTIFTMTRKILGYEILEMKNKGVKSEKDSFHDKIIEQKIAFLCLI